MTFFKRVADRDVDAAHNAICDAERAYECSYTPADRAIALHDLADAQRALVGAIAERVSANRWPTRPVTCEARPSVPTTIPTIGDAASSLVHCIT